MLTASRRPARLRVLAALATGALAAGAAFGGGASAAAAPPDPLAYGFQGEGGLLKKDADRRVGVVTPTAAQQAAVRALGARAVWNALGSPDVLTRDDAGYLSGPQAGKPVDVARAWVARNAVAFGLSEEQVSATALPVLLAVPLLEGPEYRQKRLTGSYPTRKAPYVVTFQQKLGNVPVGMDGLLTVGLDPDGRVAYASSTVTRDTQVRNTPRLGAVEAYLAAAEDAGVPAERGDLTLTDQRMSIGSQIIRRVGVKDDQGVRLTSLPTPNDGVRLTWEVMVLQDGLGQASEHPHAYRTLVDAETGKVLYRNNALQHADDTANSPGTASVPYWKVFANAPKFPRNGVKTPDTRVFWCFAAGPECNRVLGTVGGKANTASPYAYDEVLTDTGQRTPTFSTSGNNAHTAPSRVSPLTPDAAVPAFSPSRTYEYPFTDQWHSSGCDPASIVSPDLADVDAATTNLFVMHNRMHDWSYYLGFTEETFNMQVDNVGSENDSEAAENDPEIGQSQSGSIVGGPTFLGRDNANQRTMQDGVAPITNQYLWEPLQAGFYAPCVDGDYDMGIVGHEYGHAISNRMTGGPTANLSGAQAGSMGEAWSDLMAVEYLNGYGLAPYDGENRYSLAPYPTGDKVAGIRNYGMNNSPLNYSNLEYDGNGLASPHADGEIWTATQFDIRQALVKKYNAQYPESNKALQIACADGLRASTVCPGNRRWIQLLFDGFLLQPAATSMLTSRDAILAADKMRYRGANLPTLWSAFAKRGMGDDADSKGADDLSAVPGWENPTSTREGVVRFKPVATAGGGVPEETKVFIGDYEARAMPAAISENGALTKPRLIEPGTYRLFVQGEGYGHRRMTVTIKPGAQTITLPLRKNLASKTAGGKASGDGGNFDFLIDDTEATNWGSVEGAVIVPNEPITIRGKQVTVDLAGGAHTVREVQVSTINRGANCDADPECELIDPPYDTGGQNRFAALYSFEILTCDTTAGKACTADGDFTSRLVKRAAFPAGRPRPTSPDLNLRSFAIPATKATHVRIKVLDNQCTGNPNYSAAANPEGNPLNDPDCINGFTTQAPSTTTTTVRNVISSSQKKNVRIAELQVFGTAAAAGGTTAGPGTATGQLPTTGPLPIALPALLLAGLGAFLWRTRRS